MVKYNIKMYIHYKYYYTVSSNQTVIGFDVTPKDPYDNLSKRLKKYTQKIKYPPGNYNPDDCILYIYDDYAFVNSFILSLYNPQKKINFVEFYFKKDDTYNRDLLVVGINEEGSGTTYYTYNHLVKVTVVPFSYKATHKFLPTGGKFFQDDLLTRLLEEIGLRGIGRKDRLVVKLDDRPPEGAPNTYPKTGPNVDKITVSKQSKKEKEKDQSDKILSYFDKYTHKFRSKETYSGFYVSCGVNSIFFENDGIYKNRGLECVDVYYNKCYKDKFVIVLLKFDGTNKYFTYTQFQTFFDKKDATQTISPLTTLKNNQLLSDLEKENDKLNPVVTFFIEETREYSHRIDFKDEKLESDSEFKKYTHEVKSNYYQNNCSVLYKGKPLVKKKGNEKDEEEEEEKKQEFEEIEELKGKRFCSLIVYFSNKNLEFPLIIKLTSRENTVEYYKREQNGDEKEYWEVLKIEDGEDENSQLLKILKEQESQILTSIYLLLDRQTKYGKSDFQSISNIKLTESQPKEIDVKQDQDCFLLKTSDFKCFKHDISCGNSGSSCANVKLKFAIFNAVDINLYDNNSITYLYREINKQYDQFKVYFYKEDQRPLLLSYGTKFYRPKNKDRYPIDWECVKSVTGCDGSGADQLLETLNEVAYFMNTIIINEKIDRTEGTSTTYTTHTFNTNTEVQIKLESKEMDCFKEYVHSSVNKFPLGEIIHQGNKIFDSFDEYKKVNGTNIKFLEKVYAYYYLYDGDHSFPLLIKLEFKDSSSNATRRYFKLANKVTYEWTKMDNTISLVDKKELEKLLKEIKDGLSIDYDKTEKNLIIKTNARCKEGSAAGPVAGVLVTLSMIGGGAAGVAYKYPGLFPSIYRRIV